jgi:hypothetical protein
VFRFAHHRRFTFLIELTTAGLQVRIRILLQVSAHHCRLLFLIQPITASLLFTKCRVAAELHIDMNAASITVD